MSWRSSVVIFICSAILFASPFFASAATNLLENPSVETGDFTGWNTSSIGNCNLNEIIYGNSDHNECLRITGGGRTGDFHVKAAYDWGTISQEVDLVAKGYSAETLDAQPTISTGIWAASGIGMYRLIVRLRDADHEDITVYDTGDVYATDDWTEASHTFSAYGAGVRYVSFEISGKDTIFWSGHFGVGLDDAYVNVVIPYTFTYSTGNGGSLNGTATQTVNAEDAGSAVTAVPNPGYHFVSWSDSSRANPRTDTNASGNITVSAIFEANRQATLSGGSLFKISVPEYAYLPTQPTNTSTNASAVLTTEPKIKGETLDATTVRDLSLGMTGKDVLALQRLLNTRGFIIAPSGIGSPGNETAYFGPRTKKALERYQKSFGIVPASGYFGAKTRTQMKAVNVEGVWW